MTLPSVPATAIVSALDEFDDQLRSATEWQNWEANGNYEHALVRDGKRYPVKQIVSMATGMPKTEFGGGAEANTYLQKLGFTIEPIREQTSIRDRQIFVFVASKPQAQDNLRRSVDHPISPGLIAEHLGEEDVRQLGVDAAATYAWGAVPGQSNTPTWERMRSGDYVLAVVEGRYARVARVIGRIRSAALARAVWPSELTADTWELVYFLSLPQTVDIPVSQLENVLRSQYFGFTRIGDDSLANIRERYGSVDEFIGSVFVNIGPPTQSEVSLGAALEAIMAGYPSARRSDEFSSSHPLFQTALTAKQLIDSSSVLGRRPHLLTRVSFGRGNWASVPWLAVMDERETTTTRHGIYCVYLFREDGSGVFLTLNQGVTEPRQRLGGVEGRKSLRAIAKDIRPQIRRLEEAGFILDENVDLRSNSSLGEDYQVSTVAHKLYSPGAMPDDPHLFEDLEALVAAYESVLETRHPEPTLIELFEVHQSFAEALSSAGLRFGASHDMFVRSFVASLVTKPLVILTGLSGSGKTQLALKFGEWLGEEHSMVVPVRPDWTGPEALFGYVDALKTTSPDGRASWFVPDTLDFILTAARDPTRPYLLVLDEMNLAHVERYFADFLSGVESRTPILPNLIKDAGEWRVDPEDSTKLAIPRNLFVVGTVNVDETTYMFSPKVLDRANTMEFRVQTADLPESPGVPGKLPPGPGNAMDSFLQAAMDDEFHKKRPAAGQTAFAGQLRALHSVLSRHGAEFGYRSFYEAIRFSAVYAALGDTSWQRALDLQVMQKVLPRLHGGRRKVERLLAALGLFCFSLSTDENESFDPIAPGDGEPKLPISFDKVQRMTSNVRANQFVSFSE
jgi:hypothetical protein